jgi:hypothetical protein
MAAQRKPRLGVLYDVGSASPVEIYTACRRLCEVVFLVDHDPGADGEAPPGFVDLAGAEPDDAAKMLLDLDIGHLITFSDRRLVRTAEIAAAAGLRFLPVTTAIACQDKLVQRKTLAEAGVDTVRSAAFTDPAELPGLLRTVGLPAIVKPRYGAGSVDTLRIDTTAEARQWSVEQAARIGSVPGTFREFVVEELLKGDRSLAGPGFGDFVSVESMVEGDRVRHLCVTGKFPLADPFREGGMLLPSTLAPDLERRCRELAEAAIRALGISVGITHTELKLTPAGPRIIEVNGRPPGYTAELLSRATGGRFDLIGTAVRLALGLPGGDLPVLLDGVTYVYFLQPPREATRLVAMAEAAAAATVPGVRRFEPFVRPGSPIDWRWGTSGHLGLIFGEAADHQAALADVQHAVRALDITYE